MITGFNVKRRYKKCFVISPFGMPFDRYYKDIIAPAVHSLGMKIIRADEIYGVRPIMDDIIRGIIDADVIIAEVTSRNPNVNYELGMAHALGKPVVILSQAAEDIPFDYRHIRAILYNTRRATWATQLTKKISNTIQSVINDKSHAFLHTALEEFHNRGDRDKTLGLTAIYSTRQQMNVRADSLFGELRMQLDICAFGLKSFRDAKNSEMRQKVKDGLKIRILAPAPGSPFLAQRERDEKAVPGEMKKRIIDLVKWVKQLKALSPSPQNVTLKLYKTLPLDFYWHQEHYLFVGPYLYGRGSQQTITFEFEQGGSGYSYFATYFEEIWADDDLITSAV